MKYRTTGNSELNGIQNYKKYRDTMNTELQEIQNYKLIQRTS